MNVGVLTLELATLEARTLKEKRRITQGFKQRLRNRFNVSVAEVAHGDLPKRCRIAVAMVAKESRPLHSQLDRIVDMVRRTPGLTLVDYAREFF
jgi:uncharacterized protein YlxP (DUF503 family)